MPILSTEQIVSLIVEEPMIENPELTLKILRHIARDDVAFPANLTLEDIQAQFPGEDGDAIAYSVVCAFDAGFLMGGEYRRIRTGMQAHYRIANIDGLSRAGGEYVRAAATHYQEAVAAVRKMGWDVTTDAVSRMLRTLFDIAARQMFGP